ncbi:MAG: hypothetical protein HZB99_03595 [Candidatus Harrisonbacteria bacterium]|nr:hypothetical protein [Candidatus Harrisonbacteria bacterium]
MEKSIFKAYDVRGKYPSELNEEAAFKISKALGKYFGSGAKIVIGHDARLSSPTLYRAALKGFRVQGLGDRKNIKKNLNPQPSTLYPAGLITTPMLYFLVNKLGADGGIMVTASHNPKEYNGLKVVGKNAKPISGREILKIMNKEL